MRGLEGRIWGPGVWGGRGSRGEKRNIPKAKGKQKERD